MSAISRLRQNVCRTCVSKALRRGLEEQRSAAERHSLLIYRLRREGVAFERHRRVPRPLEPLGILLRGEAAITQFYRGEAAPSPCQPYPRVSARRVLKRACSLGGMLKTGLSSWRASSRSQSGAELWSLNELRVQQTCGGGRFSLTACASSETALRGGCARQSASHTVSPPPTLDLGRRVGGRLQPLRRLTVCQTGEVSRLPQHHAGRSRSPGAAGRPRLSTRRLLKTASRHALSWRLL